MCLERLLPVNPKCRPWKHPQGPSETLQRRPQCPRGTDKNPQVPPPTLCPPDAGSLGHRAALPSGFQRAGHRPRARAGGLGDGPHPCRMTLLCARRGALCRPAPGALLGQPGLLVRNANPLSARLGSGVPGSGLALPGQERDSQCHTPVTEARRVPILQTRKLRRGEYVLECVSLISSEGPPGLQGPA